MNLYTKQKQIYRRRKQILVTKGEREVRKDNLGV